MKRPTLLISILLVLAGAIAATVLHDPLSRWITGAPAQAAPGVEQATHAGHGGHDSNPTTGASRERKVLNWYDRMNPSYRSERPGKAPDGMDLVPRYADEEASTTELAPGSVQVTAQKQQLIGVKTETVQRQRITRSLRTVAQLEADETKLAHIHVKYSGWLDKVYVNYIGSLVKKGQPLFSIYSPDLVSTQQEYLIARRGVNSLGNSPYQDVSQGSEALLRASRERLRLWDISEEQIAKLDKTGEVTRTMTFNSPINGFVLDRKAFPQVAVTPDMELYTLVNLSTIWAIADVYEYEVPYVRVGQRAEMQLSYFPGKAYSGRVTYISPTVDPQTRTVKVRLEFLNPRFGLKPQMFAEVELKIDYGDQIVLPQEAVLDSGTQQTVFIAHEDGYFEPRTIKTGARLDDRLVVLSGIRPGETIVTSGNFLIDSESRLKSAMGGMKH